MQLPSRILSDIVTHMKYAKFLPALQRRESWEELCWRNADMHIKKYPQLEDEIRAAYKDYVIPKKVLTSMRSMQFAGRPIELAPNRLYNCCAAPVDDPAVFSEFMFLLLGGSGVGFSVQRQHVEKLPPIKKPTSKRTRRYLVSDDIEGWADAVKILMNTYFKGTSRIRFDLSGIRKKGSRLVTSGGKAPGPQPLRECLVRIEGLLSQKEDGDQLTPIECHDIVCFIADAVLAGGIRRAALISLFSLDDEEMLAAKSGNWWETHPWRARANNSAVVLRHKVTEEVFMNLWDRAKESRAGEPAIYLTNDANWLTNPCCEIALRPCQFCNLTEINASDLTSQEEYNNRARVAAFLGTLQAGYTDFHYLRPIWQKNTEKDALLGVSMTGIASGGVMNLNQEEATLVTIEENKRVAALIGVNEAARITCVKPAGTTSLVLGCSSGIHAWHNDYYLRRLRVKKDEPIYAYLAEAHPELVEDEFFSPHDTAVITVPQSAPKGATTRHEPALEFLERIKLVSENWVRPGHIDGQNTHNVSATVNLRDDEWDDAAKWMWENRDSYNGLSVFPYDGGTYKQTPFEDCDGVTFLELLACLKDVDLRNVHETEDNTDLSGEVACSGGQCEVF